LLSGDLSSIFLLATAPAVGSFLATTAVRLPQHQNPSRGRSHCPHCAHVLGPRDLVPVLSWLVQRGRCRYCGDRIDPLYPIVEIAALGVAVWAVTRTEGWTAWATCGLGWALLVLAAVDLRHYILPNALTLPLIAAGLGVAGMTEPSLLGQHAIGAAAGLAAFAVVAWVYRRVRGRDGLGMGDVKLLAAAGAWTSWAGLPGVVLWACISAFAVVLLQAAKGQSLSMQSPIAFGAHLCVGIWLVWMYGPLEFAAPS
jgi:leader peptidase (prepilin peptidase)/N-methyltransferase